MRLLKEVYLRDLPIGAKFLVDGAWYVVRNNMRVNADTRFMVELTSEFYVSKEELDSGAILLEIGDTVMYRADLVVITEVE